MPAEANADAKEQARLQALHSYKILDTDPEKAFDDLTILASHICDTPVALISLIDSDRQWFKSRVGLSVTETPREVAFCNVAIASSACCCWKGEAQRGLGGRFSIREALQRGRCAWQVPELLACVERQSGSQHLRYPARSLLARGDRFVVSDPKIRFYAGAPITSSDGHPLGTLCVVDVVPRELTPSQQNALLALSHQVQAQFELRKNLMELRVALQERDKAEAERDRTIVELKNALGHVSCLSGLLPACSVCKLDVIIPADPNAISGVVDGVMQIARQMKCAEGNEYQIDLALREALASPARSERRQPFRMVTFGRAQPRVDHKPKDFARIL